MQVLSHQPRDCHFKIHSYSFGFAFKLRFGIYLVVSPLKFVFFNHTLHYHSDLTCYQPQAFSWASYACRTQAQELITVEKYFGSFLCQLKLTRFGKPRWKTSILTFCITSRKSSFGLSFDTTRAKFGIFGGGRLFLYRGWRNKLFVKFLRSCPKFHNCVKFSIF